MSAAQLWRENDLKTYDGPLLLDTHIWIWYLEGDATKLAPGITALLDRAGKGKLTFSLDVTIWLKRAELAPGIRFLPLDRDTLLLSTRLQGTVHNDPADRMLIAAAKLHNVPLVTADGLIVDYAHTYAGTPVVDARVEM